MAYRRRGAGRWGSPWSQLIMLFFQRARITIFAYMKSANLNTDIDTVEITLHGEQMVLHPFKAMHWPSRDTLIVSDLHLGKIHHFRNAGIFLPEPAAMDNYERLSALLMQFEPARLLILGDLFHSDYNIDWKIFSELRHTFASVQFELVIGNHDILEEDLFASNGIQVYQEVWRHGPFVFSHFPIESEEYCLCGHIHPGVRLVGLSRQSLRLPCFYFGQALGILPAFGTFTGTTLIQPEEGDRVFVVSEDQIREVH